MKRTAGTWIAPFSPRLSAERDAAEQRATDMEKHYAPFVTIVAALATYGETANLAALVEKARSLNDAERNRRVRSAALSASGTRNRVAREDTR